MSGRPKIVILGMLTRIPVAGAIWQNIHYLVGLERLGFEPYYVEAHARTPTALMRNDHDDASLLAANFLDRLMRRFGLGDRWAFHALHDADGGCHGLSEARLRRLYRDAALIVNLHGGTVPLPEHGESGRLVYLETDPVELEIELHDGLPHAVEFAEAHRAFSSWALNYGNGDCHVPLPEGIDWLPAPPPVLLDLWPRGRGPGHGFTTVGNWRQWGEVEYRGEVYTWSKHHEFLKFLELPRAAGQTFELALGGSSFSEDERELLESNGWLVRRAEEMSDDLDAYRDYIASSRGEFTVAKDQNVRLRSGWFSERSAVYLASGRPVITQDTGFGSYLPTGEGLFAFSTLDDALAALEAIDGDYARHSRAARRIAEEFLDAAVVLPRLLEYYGLEVPRRRAGEDGEASSNGTVERRVARLRAHLAELRTELGTGHAAEQGAITAEAYGRMIERLRRVVDRTLPTGSRVLVVSRGDSQLLRLGPRLTEHFPQTASGVYLGHHPADSNAAIRHLDDLRGRGAEYLILPQTSFWWLDFYGEFRDQLETSCGLVARVGDTCRIYALDEHARARAGEYDETVEEPSPDTPEVDETSLRLEVARSLLELSRTDEAARVLEEGLELVPGQPDVLVELAACAEARGDGSLARTLRLEAGERAGDDYEANLELARHASRKGRESEAENRLLRLQRLYPDDRVVADELIAVACSRAESGDRVAVEQLEARLATLDPESVSPSLLLRVADVLGGAGLAEAGLSALGAALPRLPREDPALRDFAERLLRPTATAVDFEDRVRLGSLLTYAGDAYVALRDRFRGEACFRVARRAAPAAPAPAFNLAWAAITSGRPLDAAEELSSFTRVYPDESSAILWPRTGGRPWPEAPLGNVDSFDDLKPRGTAWPRVTVITPSFNQAAFVEETILSVLHQCYPNLEYIVVDAESTDGTRKILRRYERRLSRLIIEPDRGQSEAINKGLRLATGELVLWLNSDDMLAPGALYFLGAAHLATGADVVAGFCCEHSEGRFGVINLPAASDSTFNLACLGDIFERWLKGHFFYQPEVAFSRRILERVGGTVREDLHYTMDYEFWLRCAKAGASVSVVPWPIGLFRKHVGQKTHELDAAVIEQGEARDQYVLPRPSFERQLLIEHRLRKALTRRRPRVLVASTRADKIFSSDTGREVAEALAEQGYAGEFTDRLELDRSDAPDLVISLIHLQRENEALRKIREAGCQVPVLGWTWDNHHHVFANHRAASDVDVLVPGHGFAAVYLRSPRYVLTEPEPLCVTQWSASEAELLFPDHGLGARVDALYGGFVRYRFAARRNDLLEKLQESGMEGIYLLEEDALDAYFGLAPDERFAEWAAHKTSLCLPLSGDLSQRFYDALLAGQVPIVPADVADLDRVVPRSLQRELPVVRLQAYTVEAVRKAHRDAIAAFDAGGPDGAWRRHRFVLDNHMFVDRVGELLRRARALAGVADSTGE